MFCIEMALPDESEIQVGEPYFPPPLFSSPFNFKVIDGDNLIEFLLASHGQDEAIETMGDESQAYEVNLCEMVEKLYEDVVGRFLSFCIVGGVF